MQAGCAQCMQDIETNLDSPCSKVYETSFLRGSQSSGVSLTSRQAATHDAQPAQVFEFIQKPYWTRLFSGASEETTGSKKAQEGSGAIDARAAHAVTNTNRRVAERTGFIRFTPTLSNVALCTSQKDLSTSLRTATTEFAVDCS